MGLFGTQISVQEGGLTIPSYSIFTQGTGLLSHLSLNFFSKTAIQGSSTGASVSMIYRMPVDGTLVSIVNNFQNMVISGTLRGSGSITASTIGFVTKIEGVDQTWWCPNGTSYPGTVDSTTIVGTYGGTSQTAGTTTFQMGNAAVTCPSWNTNVNGTVGVGIAAGTYFTVTTNPIFTGCVYTTAAAAGTASITNQSFLYTGDVSGVKPSNLNNQTESTFYAITGVMANGVGGTYVRSSSALQNTSFMLNYYATGIPIAYDTAGGTIPFSRFDCIKGLSNAVNSILTPVTNMEAGTASTNSWNGNRIILPYSCRVSGIVFTGNLNGMTASSSNSLRACIYSTSGSAANDILIEKYIPYHQPRYTIPYKRKVIFDTPIVLQRGIPYYYGIELTSTTGIPTTVFTQYTGVTFGTDANSSSALTGTVGSTIANLNYLDTLGTNCCLAVRSSGGTAPFNWALDYRMRFHMALLIDAFVFPDQASTFIT